MSVLYLLIPLSILIAAIALGAFLWAVRRGQFDDLEGPAYRAMLDDEGTTKKPTKTPRHEGTKG